MQWIAQIIKKLLCRHKYEFIPLAKPFFGYPIYSDDGYWIKDVYAHKCKKCKKVMWKDDFN